MKKFLVASLALSSSILLVGCGATTNTTNNSQSGSTSKTTATTKSACSLLTKDIAEKVVEAKVGPVNEDKTDTKYADVTTCNYLSDDGKMRGIGLLVRHSKEDNAALSSFDSAIELSKSLSGVDPEMITGMGDKAYWAGGTLKQLNILIGDDLLIFTSLNKDVAVSKSLTKKAADLVLPNF